MSEQFYIVLKYLLISLIIFAFLLEAVIWMIALRYKKMASNISKTENQIFRAIRLRYINSLKLGMPIKNVKSYIIKTLCGKGGFLGRIMATDRFCCLISFMCIIGGIALTLIEHERFGMTLFAASFSFYVFRAFCGIDMQSRLIIMFTEDQLDNVIGHKVDLAEAPSRNKAKQKETETVTQEEKVSESTVPKTDTPKKQNSFLDSIDVTELLMKNNSEDIIEYVLKEYLT